MNIRYQKGLRVDVFVKGLEFIGSREWRKEQGGFVACAVHNESPGLLLMNTQDNQDRIAISGGEDITIFLKRDDLDLSGFLGEKIDVYRESDKVEGAYVCFHHRWEEDEYLEKRGDS